MKNLDRLITIILDNVWIRSLVVASGSTAVYSILLLTIKGIFDLEASIAIAIGSGLAELFLTYSRRLLR